MGYELHIVRQRDYDDEEEESNITMEEWINYVASDKELILTGGYELPGPEGKTTWQKSPGFCEWVGHIREDGSLAWFDYSHGCISSKFPDDDMIKKMLDIAISLHARVRGDEFEYYDESYFGSQANTTTSQDPIFNKQTTNKERKPWWKIW